MISFNSDAAIKLHNGNLQQGFNLVEPVLIDGEEVISCFQGVRDFVIFTDKRIIAVDQKGVTATRKSFLTMPYSKISMFNVENAGVFGLEGAMELWFNGVGKVRFEFMGQCDLVEICQLISTYIL